VDGADLPESQIAPRPARRFVQIGQTYDAEFTPPGPGEYILTAKAPVGPPFFTQRLTFR
jgi:hypothetical protein